MRERLLVAPDTSAFKPRERLGENSIKILFRCSARNADMRACGFGSSGFSPRVVCIPRDMHLITCVCVCVEQIKRVSVYKSSVMRHSCSRAQQYPCHRAAASNKFLHESKAQRMQKMLCDNFYKACCDQWGVSSLWLHGKCFANEHRRRDTQRAPRADRRPTTTTVVACGSAHLCEKGFA